MKLVCSKMLGMCCLKKGSFPQGTSEWRLSFLPLCSWTGFSYLLVSDFWQHNDKTQLVERNNVLTPVSILQLILISIKVTMRSETQTLQWNSRSGSLSMATCKICHMNTQTGFNGTVICGPFDLRPVQFQHSQANRPCCCWWTSLNIPPCTAGSALTDDRIHLRVKDSYHLCFVK